MLRYDLEVYGANGTSASATVGQSLETDFTYLGPYAFYLGNQNYGTIQTGTQSNTVFVEQMTRVFGDLFLLSDGVRYVFNIIGAGTVQSWFPGAYSQVGTLGSYNWAYQDDVRRSVVIFNPRLNRGLFIETGSNYYAKGIVVDENKIITSAGGSYSGATAFVFQNHAVTSIIDYAPGVEFNTCKVRFVTVNANAASRSVSDTSLGKDNTTALQFLLGSPSYGTEGTPITDFTATLNRYNWRYTGEFITPTLTITNPDTQEILVENVDYTKTYTNNLNPGTANVLAAGIGDYDGSKSIDFYIIAADITISVNCTLNKYTWEYTGEFITPEVQVWDTLEEVQLTNGVDYQYTYTNNLNVGTATVTIVGIGNWTGSVTLDFQIISGDDPYDPGGDNPSGPGGGEGDQDDQSDPIPFPSLPTLDAISSGFATIYVPTLTELSNLANYMWVNNFENMFNRLFANPMDAVLGLSVVPCAVSYVSGTVFVGNVGTGITMRVATTQYVVVDLGELTVEEFWGSYLDYNPYTRISAYLPYIGFRDLNADDIIGKAMRLHYVIDIVSGACVAMIRVDGSVLYSFSGSCAQNLPINANDWTENVKTAISVGATVGSMIATAGATAPVGAATAVNLAANAQNIIKPRIQNSGMVGGSSGFLGVQTPYLVITRPNLCLPANQNKYTGYPIYSTVRLDQLTGYTKVSDIQLDTIPATHDEIEELYNILTEGFIIQ